MKNRKIVIVGGASTYTQGIVGALLENMEFIKFSELILCDIDKEWGSKMANFLRIYFREQEANVSVRYEEKLDIAFKDADFILVQIRHGGMKMRVLDEKICVKNNLVGQETCGAGGFAFALREISPMIEIIKVANKVAPQAWVINYSNPIGILVEAVPKEVDCSKVVWICDQPSSDKRILAWSIGMDKENIEWDYYGLNHFGWFTQITNKNTGENLVPKIRKAIINEDYGVDENWVDEKGRPRKKLFNRFLYYLQKFEDEIPNQYMQYYFFPNKQLAKMKENGTRAEEVYNTRFLSTRSLIEKTIENDSTGDFKIGVHALFIVKHIVAICEKKKQEVTINVPNNGYFKNWPNDEFIEVPGYISHKGLEFKKEKGQAIISRHYALMRQQKQYEKMVYKVWKTGSYQIALQALSLNKLVNDTDSAKEVLDDLIKVNDSWPKLS